MLSLLVQEINKAVDNFKRDCELLSMPLGSHERIESLKLQIQESVQKYWSCSSSNTLPFDMNSKSLKRLNILTKIRALLRTKLYNAEKSEASVQNQQDLQTYLSKVEKEISKLGVSISQDSFKEQFNASIFSVSVSQKSLMQNYSGAEMLKNVRAEGEEIERKLREKSFLLTGKEEHFVSQEQIRNQTLVEDKIEQSVQKVKNSEFIVSPSPIDFKSKTELMNLMQLHNEELEKGSEHNYSLRKIEEEKESLEKNNLSEVENQMDQSCFSNHSDIYLPSLGTETQNSILEEENRDINIGITVDVVAKQEGRIEEAHKKQIKKTKDFLKKEGSKKKCDGKIMAGKSTPKSTASKFKSSDRPGTVKQKVTVLQKKPPRSTSRGAIIKGGSTTNKQIEVSCQNMQGLLCNLQEREEERGQWDSLNLLENQKKQE